MLHVCMFLLYVAVHCSPFQLILVPPLFKMCLITGILSDGSKSLQNPSYYYFSRRYRIFCNMLRAARVLPASLHLLYLPACFYSLCSYYLTTRGKSPPTPSVLTDMLRTYCGQYCRA